MNTNELYEGLSNEQIEHYKEEAKRVYGKEIVKKSEDNIKKHYNNDYELMKKKFDSIFQEMVTYRANGAESPEIQAATQKLRDYINTIYDCTPEIFRGLGQLYQTDPRFIKNLSRFGDDFPQFLGEAIDYYCNQL